jgi:hypothetical protein
MDHQDVSAFAIAGALHGRRGGAAPILADRQRPSTAADPTADHSREDNAARQWNRSVQSEVDRLYDAIMRASSLQGR